MRLITYKDLRPKYGIKFSRRQLKRKELDGTFPLRIKHGDAPQSAISWIEQEIVDYLEALKRQRDEAERGAQ